MLINVTYVVNGTTCQDWFHADGANSTMDVGGTVISFNLGSIVEAIKDGGEKLVPVVAVQYQNAERVIKYQ